MGLFAWAPTDIPGIDPDVVCRQLGVQPRLKFVTERKCKVIEEIKAVVLEKVRKLLETKSIQDIKYPT